MVIRNMALQPVRVSGRFRIRKADFPCTLNTCCEAEPAAACCPRNYTRLYLREPACGKCPRDTTNPNCRPYDATELPGWSARGPATVQPSQVDRTLLLEYGKDKAGSSGWQKPDLVAPGAAVSANSDGNRNSAGDGEEYGVQCGEQARPKTTMFGCDVIEGAASQYLPTAGSLLALPRFYWRACVCSLAGVRAGIRAFSLK